MRRPLLFAAALAASLLLLASAQEDEDEVALIIGGYWLPGSANAILSSVELFGCLEGGSSVPMPPYPENTYLPGAVYLPDEERVLSCGGFRCPTDPQSQEECDPVDECHYWNQNNGNWNADGPSFQAARFNFLMTLAPNLDSVDDSMTPVPLALGGTTADTEVYDPVGDSWLQYRSIDSTQWVQLGCLFQEGDAVYSIRNEVEVLNVTEWIISSMGEDSVPDELVNPRKCAYAVIDGVPGIFTRYGYWYNLETGEWVKKAVPPYEPVGGMANAMFKFRGRPTIFGDVTCGDEGECENKKVVQYMSETDEWVTIGEMLESRTYHEVVMVPREVCDTFVTSTTPAPSTTPPADSNAEPTSTLGERAALIIGGTKASAQPNTVIATAELFGCPNSAGDSVRVADLPAGLYQTGSALMPDGDRVIMCGGFGCEGNNCQNRDDCYFWSPETNTWDPAPQLNDNHFSFIMALAPNIDTDNDEPVPIVVGNGLDTEIMDADFTAWTEYKPVDDVYFASNCFFQHDGLIYSFREEIVELNPYTWNTTILGSVPNALDLRARCSPLDINGELGVMLSIGNWFSLRSLSWRKLAAPPIDPIATYPNAMFNYAGRPTIFGSPNCDSSGECEHREVIQYDPDTDMWVSLGFMTESRLTPEVVDVPVEFCDSFVLAGDESNVNNEAAIIIGGYWDDGQGGTSNILDTVEIFGCNDDESVSLGVYPGGQANLPAATFMEESGKVISCGGYNCDDDPCVLMSECYYWSPATGQWEDAPALTDPKFDFFMIQMPNVVSGDDSYVPGAIGNGLQTNIFNPTVEQWEPYLELLEPWQGESCLIQLDDKIYHIDIHVDVLDLTDWTFQILATPPDNLLRPGRCAYAEINGEPGIFTRYGYWFNLHSEEWEKKATPPYDPVGGIPNNMWTFRNKPTVFGSSSCDDDGNCLYNQIMQYNPEADEWVRIGAMTEPRRFHAVATIPSSYCQYLNEDYSRKTAALVVGGNIVVDNDVLPLSSIELFGCENSDDDSIRLKDFPTNIYLQDGVFVDELGKVMMCGGISCTDSGACAPSSLCHYWSPETGGDWADAPEMTQTRFNFILPLVSDVGKPDDSPLAPVTVGNYRNTEIFNYDSDSWVAYEDMDYLWFGLGCLIEHEGVIYDIRNEIIALDTETWTFDDDFPPVPEPLQRRGKCSVVESNGELGIMLPQGYWYGFDSEAWVKLAIPPMDPVANVVNSMWTFRGKPTIFGNSNCDDEANCDLKDVVQYDVVTDSWQRLGTLKTDRRYHAVIEVPGEMCDYFVDGGEEVSASQPVDLVTTVGALNSLQPNSVGIRDEAAMIITGWYQDNVDNPVLSSLELFGCTGTETIDLGDYPGQEGYLMGATYMVEENRVISCGGQSCQGVSTDCTPTADCYLWNPQDNSWEEAGPLADGKFNFLMTNIDNQETPTRKMVPAAIGYGFETEIYDPDADKWSIYYDLPEADWFALGCLVQNGNTVYSVTDEIVLLDLTEWYFQNLGPVPEGLSGEGRCSFIEIDGTPGIFLRYGYWLDLTTETWHRITTPPFDPVAGLPNALWTFEGRPTIFGDAECDNEGTCTNRNIVQYDQDSNDWSIIGQMTESRAYHEVVLLPKETCNYFDETVTTEEGGGADDTVALIVGGSLSLSINDATDSVELFGCPQFGSNAVRLRDFPYSVYLHAGLYRSDLEKAMVCGGFGCDVDVDTSCTARSSCFYWPNEVNGWYEAPSTIDPHELHIMATVPNLNKPGEPMEPLVIGAGLLTEILDTDTDKWTQYRDVDVGNWYSISCFNQFEGVIYSLRDDVTVLDVNSWSTSKVSDLPEALWRSGKCAGTYIGGNPGYFLQTGYWYDLQTGETSKRAVPPVEPLVDFPNSMWSFRGRPTIFGEPVCDEEGECEKRGILQYVAEEDAWERIGMMLESRRHHEVIEMPASFCDVLAPRETTTTSETTTGSTTEEDNSDTTTQDDGGSSTDGDGGIPPGGGGGGASSVGAGGLAALMSILALNALLK